MAYTKLLLTNGRSYELHSDVVDRLIDDLMIQGSPFAGEYGVSHLPGGIGALMKLNPARSGGIVTLDKDESFAVYTILSRYGIRPMWHQATPE